MNQQNKTERWEVKLLDDLNIPLCDGKHPRLGCERERVLLLMSQATLSAEEAMRQRCLEALPEKLKEVDRFDRPFVEGFNQALTTAEEGIRKLK